eukprot:CAMPEP_0204215158 /NCGR_PEP_ID=MMETSP0361-20130328/77240_1 /ASSEMBLY_ACC=CAM_ASM_000343 /TAXON_ID=268821 /ORGANISM="Scrippsiella Hangoei, Strain SHTV-5" /LENGTH=78 /DNA_ID=CAMNT_0051179865 /DNA_START=8 /DNA_END=241 /DNA_ORIENTATION=+
MAECAQSVSCVWFHAVHLAGAADRSVKISIGRSAACVPCQAMNIVVVPAPDWRGRTNTAAADGDKGPAGNNVARSMRL